MKNIKKLIAVLLIMFTFINSNSINVFAETVADNTTAVDLYSSNYSELITLDGISYQLNYYYDIASNRCIDIINLADSTSEKIVYNPNTDLLYLDSQIISSATNLPNTTLPPIAMYDENWLYFASSSRSITISEVATAIALASAIASIVGLYCNVSMVISNMGSDALAYILSTFTYAQVYTTAYKFNSNLITQFRYDWSVTPVGGSKYGPYMTLSPIM